MFRPTHRQRKIIKEMEDTITVQFQGETWSDAKRYIHMYKPAYEMIKYHTFRGFAKRCWSEGNSDEK